MKTNLLGIIIVNSKSFKIRGNAMSFCEQMTSILVRSSSKFVGDSQVAESRTLSFNIDRGKQARIYEEISH